jgi:hypothetical protein
MVIPDEDDGLMVMTALIVKLPSVFRHGDISAIV